MADMSMGTLYDVNKDLVEKNELILSKEILENKKEEVYNFIRKTNNEYYMLLNREQGDYTVFRSISTETIFEICNCLIDECLINRGNVKGINETKDGNAIEIWLSIDGESYVYYFFPYDDAIIEL